MKVAFVNDSCERIGVEYISAVLKKGGHQVKLFSDPQLFDDENVTFKKFSRIFDFKRQLISQIREYDPDLVAFSVVTDFYQWACKLAAMLKEHMDVPIVFGGIHATSVPERVICNNFVDIICIGEGEYSILELADSIDKGEINYSIKNLWFKKNGKIISNEVRPLIEDLDSIPFADKDLFYKAAPHFSQCYYIMASRGCPNSCSYCCHSYLKKIYSQKGKYLRFRSVKNVIGELEQAKKKYHIKIVRFHDDDMLVFPVKWLEEFAGEYAKRIRIPFACFVHPNTVTMVKAELLKKAGCYDVEIGVQSVSEATRKNILNRHVSQNKLAEAIKIIRKSELKIITDNIVGIPGQKINDVIEMAKYYNQNRMMKIYCFGFRYYPKTAIIEEAQKQGYLDKKDNEDLEEGINVEAFIKGGDTLNKDIKQMQTFLTFLLYLPKKTNDFIIRKKLYRFFPNMPYFISVIFSNWLRIPYRYNWALHITVVRYRYFILKKLERFIKRIFLYN